MNRARPARVTKVWQAHAVAPKQKPGRPVNGPNYVAQRVASTKKTVNRAARSRKSAAKA